MHHVELLSGLASGLATHIEHARRVPNGRISASGLRLLELGDSRRLGPAEVTK